MSSRYNDLYWKYNNNYNEWQLYGPLYSRSEKSLLLARLKETTKKNMYVWTLADFKDETEASSISIYDAYGFEDFDTLDEAKSRVVCALANKVDSAIADLEEIAELFS